MIFNETGSGSGTGGILTVTAPAGDTVTISKDGKTKTKTADSSGQAVFKGLKAGKWTVTITNGSQTATKTVNVVTDYAVTMTYFSATIAATWPEGSSCTCSDGSTTLTAPTTSGSYTFTVPNAGTWTVSCTDGTDSDSETVTITTDGESKSVELMYWLYLFKSGVGRTMDLYVGTQANIFVEESTKSLVVKRSSTSYTNIAIRPTETIDITGYSTVCVKVNCTGLARDINYATMIVISKTKFTEENVNGFQAARKNFDADSITTMYELDVSSFSGEYYVGLWGGMDGTIYDIYLA